MTYCNVVRENGQPFVAESRHYNDAGGNSCVVDEMHLDWGKEGGGEAGSNKILRMESLWRIVLRMRERQEIRRMKLESVRFGGSAANERNEVRVC